MEINKNSNFIKQLIIDPNLIDDLAITKLIAKYPYFSAFWFIKAKRAIKNKDINAIPYFQQAALVSPNSGILYQFVKIDHIRVPLSSKSDPALSSTEPNFSIQEPFASPVGHNPSASESILPKEIIEEEIIQVEITEEEIPGQEIAFFAADLNQESPNESSKTVSRYHDDLMPYSFIWWLNKTRIRHKNTAQSDNRSEQNSPIHKNLSGIDPLDQQMREHIFHIQSPELKLSEGNAGETIPFKVPKKENPSIEKFIKEEPQIKPPSPEKVSLENKARQSAIDESGFVSETLAKIYTEQGLYHKAIETYKKLSLKFPEKSLYFADLIKQLEKQN